MLEKLNGFTAFEGSLLVRGMGPGPNGLAAWNAADGWRESYSGMADGLFFFAEDAFGGQFALVGDTVFTFEPETGESQPLAESLEEWASLVLTDYEFLTGYPVACEWQAIHGPIPEGMRLIPKIPFILGGEFDVANLYALDSVTGMRLRADIARQIRDLPDGAAVEFRVLD